jgi:hypothetical protein
VLVQLLGTNVITKNIIYNQHINPPPEKLGSEKLQLEQMTAQNLPPSPHRLIQPTPTNRTAPMAVSLPQLKNQSESMQLEKRNPICDLSFRTGLRFGKPEIVTSAAACSCELIDEGGNGFIVDTYDEGEGEGKLSYCLKTLAQSVSLRRTIRQNSFKKSQEQEFELEKFLQRLISVYMFDPCDLSHIIQLLEARRCRQSLYFFRFAQ